MFAMTKDLSWAQLEEAGKQAFKGEELRRFNESIPLMRKAVGDKTAILTVREVIRRYLGEQVELSDKLAEKKGFV